MICMFIFWAVLVTFAVIVQWKIFTKAGEPGWASLVPVYNAMVLARICGRQEIFGLVYMIPCVGPFIVPFDVAAAFGKDTGFAIGLLLLGIVFFPILAFGSAEHVYSKRGRRRRMRDDDEDDRPRRRRPDEDDEEDRPAPRRRVAANDDDEDEPPRRRPAAQEDRVKRRPPEDDRAKRRRPADDDEDEPRPRRKRPADDDY